MLFLEKVLTNMEAFCFFYHPVQFLASDYFKIGSRLYEGIHFLTGIVVGVDQGKDIWEIKFKQLVETLDSKRFAIKNAPNKCLIFWRHLK